MKTMKFKLVTSILLIVAVSFVASADELSKKLKHEFSIEKNSMLVLQNKYGKIDVQNWNENKALIEVEIIVKHPNKDKAEKLIEYLNVEFSTDGNECKAITQIDAKFFKLKGNNWGNDKEYSINYTVKMPKDLDIDLYNKYGDVFIDELTGLSKISIKYGGLQANKIIRGNTKPLSSLSLGYGKASITEVDWLKAEIKYAKLKIDKSVALMVVSKYSKLYVNEASSIVSESKYDSYEIGNIQNFVISTGYTEIEIEYLGKKLSLESKYSGTTIDKIPVGFASMEIDNSYGGVKLGIADDASYILKGEAKYAKIRFPESGRMSRIEKSNYASYDGIVGKEENPGSTVTINTSYGGVDLNH